MMTPAEKLRSLLDRGTLLTMPCCHDALSAKLIEKAGFELTFMSGFTVSATRLAMPDTGLISFGEMADQARSIVQAVTIPVIADGDTGYGNALNVKRTVREYGAAGLACVMIEDQVTPKRCGHTRGKQVVDFDEACLRIKAAADARQEGTDILVMARTDARETDGIEEALKRMKAFGELGADILFLEAPRTVEEMTRFCREIPGVKMANMIEHGLTPLLPPEQLQRIGYSIAAYPVALLQAVISSIESALSDLAGGVYPRNVQDFDKLKETLGFTDYYREEKRYSP